jgi:hypothetical protein
MADAPKAPANLPSSATPLKTERPLDKPGFTFLPRTWEELWNFAKEVAATDFPPKDMRGKPGAILAAWQTGAEIGLPAMASLQSIALINGRPSVHSKGYWAIIVTHPMCEWTTELPPEEALSKGFGECSIKRRGNPHVFTRKFSIEEAQRARLLDKDNWKYYPGDMLVARARHRAGDAAIPEACQGVLPSDIAIDLEPELPAVEKRPALSRPKPTQEIQDAGDTGATDTPSQPEREPAGTGPASEAPEKSVRDSTIEAIGEFTKDNFPDPTWLNPRIKDLSGDDKLAVTTAWNAKKKELGL